jgi:hypothetical protein
MSKAALLALADRVQALAGPCRETDAEIALALGMYDRPEELGSFVDLAEAVVGGGGQTWAPPEFTASLDAAISLYPELPDTVPSCPRKATAAALRAIAAQMPDGG